MRIPSSNQTVTPVTVQAPKQGFAAPVEAAFGTQVAQALQGLGETGTKIANAMQKHVEERRQQQNLANATAKQNQFSLDFQNAKLDETIETVDDNGTKYDRVKGWGLRRGASAIGATQEADAWYQKNKANYLKDIKDPEMLGKLSNALDVKYYAEREAIIKNERTEKIQSFVDQHEAAIKIKNLSIINAVDINGINQELDGIAQETNNIGAIKSWSQDERLVYAEKNKKIAMQNFINHNLKATGDIETTNQFINDANLSEDTKTELLDFAQTKYQQVQVQIARAQTNDLIQNRFEVISGIANGTIDPTSDPDLIRQISLKDIKLAEALSKSANSETSIFSGDGDDGNFSRVVKDVFMSENQEDISKALINALHENANGNIGKDRLAILVSAASNRAKTLKLTAKEAAMLPDAKQESLDAVIKAGLEWTERVGIRNGHVAEDILQNVNAGMAPKAAYDEAVKSAIMKEFPEVVGLDDIPNIIGTRSKIKSVNSKKSNAKGKKANVKPVSTVHGNLDIGFDDL